MTYYQSTNRIFKENIIARIYNTLSYRFITVQHLEQIHLWYLSNIIERCEPTGTLYVN
jgi:hypothetical protein